MRGAAVGTHHLVRLILRRDRIRLPLWLVGITALIAGSAESIIAVYDTAEKQAGYAVTVESSGAGKMLNGLPYDVDTLAGIVAYEATSTATVLVALMAIFLVVRHTRAEEESGRAELLRATVTGRHAATAAAVVVASLASVLAGALDAAVFAAYGFDAVGSLAHGASLAAIGVFFTAVAAAAAQVTASTRAALGISGGVLGVAFVVRGVGALADSWVAYLSPLGWVQKVRPFGPVDWIWLGVLLLATAAVLAFTVYLTAHRDAGAGLIQPRPGSPRAPESLGTAVGLAWRLQRGSVFGWGVGLVVAAVVFGSVGREVISMVEDNPAIADYFAADGAGIIESYFAFAVLMIAVVAVAFPVSSVLRLRAEEEAGRAEAVLATALPRSRWILGSLVVTVLGSVAHLLAIGVAMGATHGLVSGDWSLFGPVLGASAQLIPAVLLIAAIAAALFGWLPRLAALAWAVVAFAVLQAYLGELLRFPDWLSDLSPFRHLAAMPVEELQVAPVVVLLALACLVSAAGVIGARRRDIG